MGSANPYLIIPNILSNFPRKLHENEESWVLKGAHPFVLPTLGPILPGHSTFLSLRGFELFEVHRIINVFFVVGHIQYEIVFRVPCVGDVSRRFHFSYKFEFWTISCFTVQ